MTEGKRLGEGLFGEVCRAVDLDSGCFIAVKEMKLPPQVGPVPLSEEINLRREVKSSPVFLTYVHTHVLFGVRL